MILVRVQVEDIDRPVTTNASVHDIDITGYAVVREQAHDILDRALDALLGRKQLTTETKRSYHEDVR